MPLTLFLSLVLGLATCTSPPACACGVLLSAAEQDYRLPVVPLPADNPAVDSQLQPAHQHALVLIAPFSLYPAVHAVRPGSACSREGRAYMFLARCLPQRIPLKRYTTSMAVKSIRGEKKGCLLRTGTLMDKMTLRQGSRQKNLTIVRRSRTFAYACM